jgi:hypothetical protein
MTGGGDDMVAFVRILYVFLVAVLPVQFIVPHEQSWAQGNNSGQNQVTLTVFFLPEKEACRKRGYENYGSEKKTKCETLTRNDVKRWIELRRPYTSIKIPPGQQSPFYVALGAKCFDIVTRYPSNPSWNPEERKSVVMVFEWDYPQSGPISLEREDLRIPARIPPDRWEDELTGEKLWISNSRVDGFFPRSNVKWTLRIGGEQWIFVFKAKE